VRTVRAARPRERAVLGHFDEMIESGREDHILDLLNIIEESQQLDGLVAGAVQYPGKDPRVAGEGYVSLSGRDEIIFNGLEPCAYSQALVNC
jgi:hypothetical protein